MNVRITICIASLYVISVIGQDLDCRFGEECRNQDDCESFITERSKLYQLRRGSSAFKVQFAKLKQVVCNNQRRKVCCKLDPDSPSYVPRDGECGLSGDAGFIVGKVVFIFCQPMPIDAMPIFKQYLRWRTYKSWRVSMDGFVKEGETKRGNIL